MGSERETYEQLADGSVEFGAVGTADISTFYPEYAVSEVPYIFRNVSRFRDCWNGPLGEEIHDLQEREDGVRTVGVVLRGARYLTTADTPVASVEDVKGLTIRFGRVVRNTAPLLAPLLIVLVFIIVFPGLVTTLPNYIYSLSR